MRPIDADALLRVPNVRKVDEFDETGESVSYLAVPVECIEKAPTLDYAPVRHGTWIMKSCDNFGVCSCCNRSDHIDSLATHCRYCGASMMDGGKNDVRITD